MASTGALPRIFFRDLCLSAPFYQDSCAHLFDSLVAYGDQYLVAQDYCPAVSIYREARQQNRSPELDEKLTQAVQGCAEATPTPAPITGTLPVTGTESLELRLPQMNRRRLPSVASL